MEGAGEVKNRLTTFNQKRYAENRLNVATLNLDDNTYAMVRSMANSTLSQQYISSLNIDEAVFEGLDKAKFKLFPITDENFSAFVLNKDVNEYLEFFRSNYGN